MGASFAKAVMPRCPKRREPARESDWGLGWVFTIKTDVPEPEVDLPQPLRMHEEESTTEDRS
jgi:hypothetical protein